METKTEERQGDRTDLGAYEIHYDIFGKLQCRQKERKCMKIMDANRCVKESRMSREVEGYKDN